MELLNLNLQWTTYFSCFYFDNQVDLQDLSIIGKLVKNH